MTDGFSREVITNIVRQFVEATSLAGISITDKEVEIIQSHPPHRRPMMIPVSSQVAYVFTIGESCLKVGKAGPKGGRRLQHYSLTAPSTLAKSLLSRQANEGRSDFTAESVGDWICNHVTRTEFIIPLNTEFLYFRF